MKRVFLLLLIIAFSYGAKSQWLRKARTFGGTDNDIGVSAVNAYGGGFIFLCSSSSEDMDITDHLTAGFGDVDYWLVRSDDSLNIIWSKSFGGTSPDYPNKIIRTKNFHYIIVGTTLSSDIDVHQNHGFSDIWVTEIDSSGNIIWENTYGNAADEEGIDIDTTNDNGFIIAANVHSSNDVGLLRIDSIGNLIWSRSYGGTNDDFTSCVIPLGTNEFLVSASTTSTDGDIDTLHGGFSADSWLIKVNSANGNIIWAKCYGGTNIDNGQVILESSSNSYFLISSTTSSDGDVSGFLGVADVWVTKVDSNGTILWNHCYGGTNMEEPYCAMIKNDKIIIAGYTYSSNGNININNGLQDFMLLQIDSNGTFEWSLTSGGSSFDIVHGINLIDSANILLIGQTASNDGDVNNLHGAKDVWVNIINTSTNNQIESLDNSFLKFFCRENILKVENDNLDFKGQILFELASMDGLIISKQILNVEGPTFYVQLPNINDGNYIIGFRKNNICFRKQIFIANN